MLFQSIAVPPVGSKPRVLNENWKREGLDKQKSIIFAPQNTQSMAVGLSNVTETIQVN